MGFKIFAGIASIVALSLVTLLVIYRALDISGAALKRVLDREEPTSAAAYEMEINVVELGLKVMKYLQTGNPDHRTKAQKDHTDFERFFAQYQRVADGTREQKLGRHVGALHAQYWELAQQLMLWRDDREARFSSSMQGAERIDQALQRGKRALGPRSPAQLRNTELLAMEASLGELGQALGAYLRLGQAQSRHRVIEELTQFNAGLRNYGQLGAGAADGAGAPRIASLFAALRQDVEHSMEAHDKLTAGLARFFALRAQLDDVLDDQVQKLAQAQLNDAKRGAESTAVAARQLTLVLMVCIVLLSLVVAYFLATGITRRVRQVVAGTSAIGAGDLVYRIPELGSDELGDLARQFNRMTQQLRSITVSRDTLESSQAALRLSEERYERAVRGANDGQFDWDQTTNKLYFSPRWKSMLGYMESEVGEDPDDWLGRVHPDDVEMLKRSIAEHLARRGDYFQSEYRMRRQNGSYLWVQCRAVATSLGANGAVVHLAGSQTDIQARKVAEQQLLHATLHDPLTGLPNRNLLLDRLQRAIERAKQHEGEIFGLLFLDLDNFKLVNDSLGHPAGDRLLVSLSQRLTPALRGTDTMARFGGDEFAILVEDVKHAHEVETIAQRIELNLQQPFDLGSGSAVLVGASIGITLSTRNYNSADDMLRDADVAMYRAKSEGRGRYVYFE